MEDKIFMNHQAFKTGVYMHRSCPDEICFIIDGNMICAFRSNFVNLQESLAGFGETETEAYEALIELEAE